VTETVAQPGQRRRRWRVVILSAILLLLVSYTGLDAWAGRRVAREVARLEAKYGSFDEATLQVAIVPPADNRARIVRAAAALTIPLTGSSLSAVRLKATEPVPAETRAFAMANGPAIRMAAEIGTRRQSSWEVEYRWPGDRPPWGGIRTLSDALFVTSLLDIEAGRAEEAAKAITTGLAVASTLRQEPDLISQLMRMSALSSRPLEALQQLITRLEPSKEALADVATLLAESRSPDPMQVGLLGETKMANAVLARMEAGRGDDRVGAVWSGPLGRIGRPFVRLSRAGYLRQMGRLLDVQTGPRPLPAPVDTPNPPIWAWSDRLAYGFTRGIERSIETGDDYVSELGATEVAVALRRFRLDHGTYPESLSMLTPAYLASVAIDPYTGQPPVYARAGAGFTLRARIGPSSRPVARPALEWTVAK